MGLEGRNIKREAGETVLMLRLFLIIRAPSLVG
jgi:hypothetical protein